MKIAALHLGWIACLAWGLAQTLLHFSLNSASAPEDSILKPPVSTESFLVHTQEYSVKAFGAVGDGSVDDTHAIQRAIAAAAKAGGGTIFFPAGIYKILVQPQLSRALTIDRNITLKGEGYQNSILKLGADQGRYHAILAGASVDRDLSNFAIQDLTLDGNAAANSPQSEQSFQNGMDRFVVRIYAGKDIRIENSRFINIDDVNVLTLNNDTLVSDVVIRNNHFDKIGGGPFDHDHSTIYVHGKRSLIAQNTFASRTGPGTTGARTAIEIHGDQHQVLNNRITGYTYGINATGVASSSRGQRIEGNTITGVHSGILIWSYVFEGQQSSPGLENLLINRNQISLDIKGWRQLWGDSPNQGIALEPNSNASIKDLKITNNTIEFDNFKDSNRKTDSLAAGLVLWRYKAPQVLSENIVIAGNEVRNPLASGLYITMPIQHLEVAQNTVLNAGQGRYPFHAHYRSGLILGLNSASAQIHQNQFIDDQPQPTLAAGMLWQGTCAQGCNQWGNRVEVKSGFQRPLLLQTP